MTLSTRLIILGLACLATADVSACSCDVGSMEQNFAESAAVFRIRVTATELRPTAELEFDKFVEEEVSDEEIAEWVEEMPDYVRVSFDVSEVYKGASRISPYLYEFVFSPGNCGLGLATGIEYVIFQRNDGFEFASWCSGSFGFFDPEGGALSELERLRELFSEIAGESDP